MWLKVELSTTSRTGPRQPRPPSASCAVLNYAGQPRRPATPSPHINPHYPSAGETQIFSLLVS